MELNRTNLVNLGISFNAAFQNGLGLAPSDVARVSTPVPSTTGKEEYGWLNALPGIREWIGDRQVNNLATSAYTIKNRDWEQTVGVDRNDIEDDNLGVYQPLFTEMGQSAMAHKDQLGFGLLAAGFTGLCFDGQPYFSNAHPILDVNGNAATYANTDQVAGNGAPWFLMDGSRYIKPVIFQNRKPFGFVSLDRPDDENVFNRKEFLYGTDARYNCGYSFPQLCWGSMVAPTSNVYGAARQALMGMKRDNGRPIGVKPNLLVCGPSLEGAFLGILNAERNAAGATNVYYKTAELLVVPWLN